MFTYWGLGVEITGFTPAETGKDYKLTPSLKMEDFGDKDLIIEAVFENMALKKEIFTKLDKIVKSGAIRVIGDE